ncbi:MAG: tRNA (adenosine(37)-N6)-threonylcarbamoyltransferase complex ATPase subunit type 1 TsaE [Parcubacteria group bacterium]
MPVIISRSEKQTKKLGAKLAGKIMKNAGKPQIVFLIGELGSGKTAFSKGFAEHLGIKRVSSPTFNIVKSYKIKKGDYTRLVHADLYRVKDLKELENISFFKDLSKKGIITLIEWPETVTRKISGIKVRFAHGGNENERLIKIS